MVNDVLLFGVIDIVGVGVGLLLIIWDCICGC